MVTAFLEPALDEKDDNGCSTASASTELVIEDDGRRREIASHTEVEKLSNVVELTPLHQSLWFAPKISISNVHQEKTRKSQES